MRKGFLCVLCVSVVKSSFDFVHLLSISATDLPGLADKRQALEIAIVLRESNRQSHSPVSRAST